MIRTSNLYAKLYGIALFSDGFHSREEVALVFSELALSRSVAFVIAYLIFKDQKNLQVRFVKM